MKKHDHGSPPHPFESILRLGLRIQHLNQKLEQDSGLSLTQWSLLRCLVDHPTISALSLARSLGIQPSTLTQSLKRLEKKNFILVSRDPVDARRKLLSITRAGHSALLQSSSTVEEWEARIGLSSGPARSIWEQLRPLL